MAYIGLRYPAVAKVFGHTDGSGVSYSAGMMMGRAIEANLTINRNNNPLYADDRIAEDDTGITGMEITLNLDDIDETVQAYMLGVTETQDQGETEPSYTDTDESAPEVGFGYIRVRRKNGVTTFQVVWYYKATFALTDETAQTKGESIEWQTPSITGRIMGVSIDSSGALTYRLRKNFATEAAALAFLKSMAEISDSGDTNQGANQGQNQGTGN